MLQFIKDWVYIPRSRAKANGATHEGHLFGVPVWMFSPNEEGDLTIRATPKSRCLVPWMFLCDKAYDLASMFISEQQELVIPLRVGARIDG